MTLHTARRLFFVRSADRFRDGSDQVVRPVELGSCSLQEDQVLGHSIEALIRHRDCDGDRLPQPPCIGFAAPHERQPGVLERSVVRRATTKRLGNVGMRPDVTPRELPGRANQCTRDQAAHRQVNLHRSSAAAVSLCRRGREAQDSVTGGHLRPGVDDQARWPLTPSIPPSDGGNATGARPRAHAREALCARNFRPGDAARYLGGRRMLKRKPSGTWPKGSASRVAQQSTSGAVSSGATAHRSIETTTRGTGACCGMDPFEQPGP